jgi:two-component system alkaline phosphatase synthesis response regulator PhoP
MMQQHILIVEDDRAIAELIAMTLGLSDHQTRLCDDGRQAEALLRQGGYDLVILDVMLPGQDGFQLVEKLTQEGLALPPILYLTARIDVQDRVRGLRLGAEDYMLKPFHPVELQARVEGILRRHRGEGTVYQVLDVRLDVDRHQVRQGDREVELTPQEFALLEMLMRHKNMALSRDQLLEVAWGYDYAGGTRTVDMHIQRLRRKLGWEQVIKTVFKLGYRLEAKA